MQQIHCVSWHKCVCISQNGMDTQEYTLFTSTQMCWDDCSNICVMWNVAPIVYMSAGHLWTVRTPANEDAVKAALEWELWGSSHENWDYRSWGFLKYFFTVSFIDTASCQIHTCCHIVVIATSFRAGDDLPQVWSLDFLCKLMVISVSKHDICLKTWYLSQNVISV
jgi:hypothetical protein